MYILIAGYKIPIAVYCTDEFYVRRDEGGSRCTLYVFELPLFGSSGDGCGNCLELFLPWLCYGSIATLDIADCVCVCVCARARVCVCVCLDGRGGGCVSNHVCHHTASPPQSGKVS